MNEWTKKWRLLQIWSCCCSDCAAVLSLQLVEFVSWFLLFWYCWAAAVFCLVLFLPACADLGSLSFLFLMLLPVMLCAGDAGYIFWRWRRYIRCIIFWKWKMKGLTSCVSSIRVRWESIIFLIFFFINVGEEHMKMMRMLRKEDEDSGLCRGESGSLPLPNF